jgi:hypothetical protein
VENAGEFWFFNDELRLHNLAFASRSGKFGNENFLREVLYHEASGHKVNWEILNYATGEKRKQLLDAWYKSNRHFWRIEDVDLEKPAVAWMKLAEIKEKVPGASFVSEYAETRPLETFAENMAGYFVAPKELEKRIGAKAFRDLEAFVTLYKRLLP